MTLLPIAAPPAPATGAVTDNPAAIGSGDFTALLAMLVATASTTLPTQRPPAEAAGATPEPAAEALPPTAPSSTAAEVIDLPPPAASAPVGTEMPVAAMPGPNLAGPPAAGIAVPTSIREPIAETVGPPELPAPVSLERPETELPAPPAATIRRAPQASPAVPEAVIPATTSETAFETSSVEVPPGVVPAPVKPPKSDRPDALAAEPVPPADGSVVTDEVPQHLPDVPRRAEPDRAGPKQFHPQPQTPAVPADQPVGRPDISTPEKAEGRPAPKITATLSSSVGSPNPTVPLVAVNRSGALSPVDVPQATPVAPPIVSEQIVSAVVPLHGRGDGRHEVTLELRPDHLGTIRVEVTVEHQTVHLTLHAVEPATGRLLTAALPELRTALADAGLTAGHLGVGPDGGSGPGQWRNPSGTGETHGRGVPAGHRNAPAHDDPEPVRPVRPAAAGRLDLFL